MNTQTKQSLEQLVGYWEEEGDTPWGQEALANCKRLVNATCPLDDERLAEYFDRLSGPEGCNFRTDENGESVWTCFGGNDKRLSTAILEDMGLDNYEIALLHEIVGELGGHCDCEILFNAWGRMVPDEVLS